jgi:hypothetical protein
MIKINADKIAQEVISGLKATMKLKDRNATGRTSASLFSEFDEGNMLLRIMGAEQWQYVEQGRSPGKQPPLNRIMEWCVAKGIPKEAAFPIARKIGQFGAPKDTMKAVEPDILRELDKQAEASFEATIGQQWQSL